MSSFKIEIVKQQKMTPMDPPVAVAPQLKMNIGSMQCLNYPIETLLNIISAHFDDEPCPANYVVKALKVISVSLKDE